MNIGQDRWLMLSIAFHVGLFAPAALIAIWNPTSGSKARPVSVQSVEVPIEVKTVPAPEKPKAVKLSRKEPSQPKDSAPPKPVFGLSRDTLRDESGNSNVEIKKGNTVVKEIDDIQTDDDRSLPTPTDEYLVTSMPRLKKEVRAEYPLQARAERIEGPVVMDVLIDKTGRVLKVDIINGLGFGLDEAAKQAMLQFEFEPAQVQNQPVAVRIRYTYRFELRG